MIYLITYDLNKDGQDYEAIYKAIDEIGENIHPMKSVWFVECDKTANEISNTLNDVTDTNDLIFVTKISINEYDGFLKEDTINWLKNKLSTTIYD